MNKTHFNINDELKACEIHFKVILSIKKYSFELDIQASLLSKYSINSILK